MKRRTWLVVPLAWTALAIGTVGSGGCSASTPAGGGGNGGNEASSSSTSSASSTSSCTSSSTSVGGAFAACTDTTGSLGDCKDCCDCAAQLTCGISLCCTLGALALAAFSCADDATTTPQTPPDPPPDPPDRCTVIQASINEAGFGDMVSVSCDGTYANIVSDTYPAHEKMNGITGTNEQVPVPAPGYTSPIPLEPKKAASVRTIDAALGVAVNGVPIYDYSSQGTLDPNTYDPKADTKLNGQLDHCNGHAGRGDDYHYHAAPTCMIEAMKNKGPAAILGWALDGYPIYGNTNPDGSAIADGSLDVCNGQEDATFGYRYHTSDAPPYVLQCIVGEVDETKLPRVPPMDNVAGGGKPPGTPPQGGVSALSIEAKEVRDLLALSPEDRHARARLVPLRWEVMEPLASTKQLSLTLPPALGPVLVSFVQPQSRYATPGSTASFSVLENTANAHSSGTPKRRRWAEGAVMLALLALGFHALSFTRRKPVTVR